MEGEMINNYLISELVRQHQKNLLEEARLERLLSESRASRPRLRDRLLLKSGNILIFLGERLKEKYELRIEARLVLKSPTHARTPCD